jgi:hypothetical protein
LHVGAQAKNSGGKESGVAGVQELQNWRVSAFA